jgi:hypothetical protein
MGKAEALASSAAYTLDRREVVPALLGNHKVPSC